MGLGTAPYIAALLQCLHLHWHIQTTCQLPPVPRNICGHLRHHTLHKGLAWVAATPWSEVPYPAKTTAWALACSGLDGKAWLQPAAMPTTAYPSFAQIASSLSVGGAWF
jgi:hypothetical protein